MAFSPHRVSAEPLDPVGVAAELEASGRAVGEGIGAVCSFLGVVRGTHQGRRVRFLEYEAHGELAVRAFEHIEREVLERWPLARLAIHHRVGRLEIGDASVLVAAAAAHRTESFQVCRYGIERVKQIAPVWKHEFFEDGEGWVEGPVADPDDDAMKREALARACE
jgi:molybdopterin synthase catalytic subunit